jgi:hypothetical protein
MFHAEVSASGGQHFSSNHSTAPISETLSAGGYRYVDGWIDDNNGLDEYINNTLVQKFCRLTIDDAPLVSYTYPTAEPFAMLMLTMGQRNTAQSTISMSSHVRPQAANAAYTLNVAEERHTNCQGATS